MTPPTITLMDLIVQLILSTEGGTGSIQPTTPVYISHSGHLIPIDQVVWNADGNLIING
jgi:hypothetical protein